MTTEALTRDQWYDGSLHLWQPRDGFRATTDAVLLAAAIPATARRVIELGAGSGAASLALACRLPSVSITAVERDPLMATLLARNIAENGASKMTAIAADIFDPNAAEAWRGQHDLAFCNPPYNDAASSLSGDARRRGAMAADDLGAWITAAANAVADRGRVCLISRSDRLDEILAGLASAQAGEVVVRPVHGRADQPAKRVLVSARKGIAGPLTLLPALILRDPDGLTPAMAAISHQRGAIDLLPPGRQQRPVRLEKPGHSR